MSLLALGCITIGLIFLCFIISPKSNTLPTQELLALPGGFVLMAFSVVVTILRESMEIMTLVLTYRIYTAINLCKRTHFLFQQIQDKI